MPDILVRPLSMRIVRLMAINNPRQFEESPPFVSVMWTNPSRTSRFVFKSCNAKDMRALRPRYGTGGVRDHT